jgi:photosystem II stability/assembly factor-like uncharacterized protein
MEDSSSFFDPMKNLMLIGLCTICLSVHCQITQLYTGTTVTINHLSSYNNTVLIGGLSGNFLAKSNDEGKNLIPISCPGNTANSSFIQRLDGDTLFLLSSGYTAELYRSTDGGNTWHRRLDTTIFIPNSFSFFDGREGVVDYGYGNQILRTLNGGGAWTVTNTTLPSITIFKSFDDSILIMGGIASPNTNGVFLLSKKRGCNWPFAPQIMKAAPADFCFLNSDTIFGVSYRTIWGSTFTRSTDGGQNWQTFPEPLYNNDRITKRGSELYVAGSDDQNIGYVARSTDFGNTWSTFSTGITTRLKALVFLSDSIALLSGTNGVLLRWNYKYSLFTSIKETEISGFSCSIFPNPVKDDLTVTIGVNDLNSSIGLYNSFGQLIYKTNATGNTKRINVAEIPKGLYFLRLGSGEREHVYKVIKE